MASEMVVGVLNVIAHPHPTGIYERLLASVARRPVRFWGDEHAAITAPETTERGLHVGQVLVWTEVDPDLPAISKSSLEEVDLDRSAVEFTQRYGVNLKVFTYVLRTSDHRIFFEAANEAGKHLSPARAAKIFGTLLAPPFLDPEADPVVEVLVQPSEDALARVLAIHRLTRLEIDIPRPNADDMTAAMREVFADLEAENAGRFQKTLVAQRGHSLVPGERTRAEAALAAQTAGEVHGIGKDKDGERDDRSTKAYPRTIRRSLEDFASRLVALTSVARQTTIRDRDR